MTYLTEAINHGNPAATQALGNLRGSGFDGAQSLAMLDRIVNAQAYVLSADDIFYASAIIFLLLIPLLWVTRPPPGGNATADAAGAH